MKRLSEGLGITLSQLMEPAAAVKEERAVYISARTVPVIELADVDSTSNIADLTQKSDTYEAAVSADSNAFYLRVTPGLAIRPVIEQGNLILIEPSATTKEGDMILLLSEEKKCLGRIYYAYGNLLIQPLDQALPPVMLRKKEMTKRHVRILRVSGIKK